MRKCAYAQALNGIPDPGKKELSSRGAQRLYGVAKSVVNAHRAMQCACDNTVSRPEPGARHQPTTGRVLIIDIERLPGKAWVFDPKTRYIGADNWIEWPRTICYAARWYGDKEPIFEAEWLDQERMIRRAWELYDEADAVVTYNGVRFDNKHLRTAWLDAGYGPPRPFKDIDLFQSIKQFGYEAKGLDPVTRRLGQEGKVLKYNLHLADRAANGDTEAQTELRTYNIGDIELTEWLYDRLRGWIPNHPYLGRHNGNACNQCGSENLKRQPNNYRAVVIDYALYRCNNCGANIRAGWEAKATTSRGVRA